jgi:molybdopterin converting factor small subunit
MIEIHLFGKLRRFSEQESPLRDSIILREAHDGDTIRRIVERIGIPMDELGRNIFLNGEYSGLDRRVKDGDRLGIFPDNMQLLYRQYFEKVEED